MILKLFNFISGYLYVEVYGQKKERFINLCSKREVSIWKLNDIDSGYGFYIYAKDFKLLKEIIKKTKLKIKIKERYGLPFFLFKYRKRKAFLLGIITSFVIVYVMSLFVWDISVGGNYSYTKYEVIKFLKENQVYHGMKKSGVDCDSIEKLIRNNYFDITWVSVELTGTRLVVHIKENFDDIDEVKVSDDSETTGYMLVTDKQAVIESIITRKGVPMVKAGDVVEPGSILIDGKYNINGDYDEFIRTEYVKADGDIYGYVTYDYNEILNRNYTLREYTGEEHDYKRIRMNDKILDLDIFGMNYEKYDKIEEQISLVGDFYIPVYFSKIICREYVNKQVDYTDEEMEMICNNKLSTFLKNLSEKGIQIIENNVKIEVDMDFATAKGEIKVLEKIGQLKPVEIFTEETTENNE